MKDLLLSPQSRKTLKGYTTCSFCFSGMQPNVTTKKIPPKFAVANGFVIESLPHVLKWTTNNGETEKRKIMKLK
jgi:hypothetical protein